MLSFLEQVFFHNRILDYAIFVFILLIGVMVIQIIKKYLLYNLNKQAIVINNPFYTFLLSILRKNLIPLFYYGVFYFSLQCLELTMFFKQGVSILGVILLTFFGIRFSMGVVIFFLENLWLKKETDSSRIHVIKSIITVLRVIFWILAVIIVLDNLEVKISALVAGLGIGGIAIALAAQKILGDLFSYFIIYFDRPFEIGDFIIVDDYIGTVEYIGIKTVRIRSLGGEQLVLSNTDLIDSRLRNYKRMNNRRVCFQIKVTYEMDSMRLKEIPGIISNIIKSVDDTIFERSHFVSYGDFSLNFETVYYVIGNDYNKYMDIHQTVNFQIKEEFEKRNILFAYPTQMVYVNKNES